MPLTNLNVGAAANDGTGDTLRSGGQKINTNYTFTVTTDTAQTITGAKSFTANVGIGTTSPTQPLDVNGNVAITGSARRIIGDFSDATLANRTLFQTSAANAQTSLGLIPTGTGGVTAVTLFGNSDVANATYGQMRVETGVDVRFLSTRNGTGSFVPMRFFTSDTERLRITTAGALELPSGSPGIVFNAGSGGTSKALNDYEEGNWTPTFSATTPGTFSVSYSVQLGRYTKIGTLVIASFSLSATITKGTATGDLIIGNLPFNCGEPAADLFTGPIGFMSPVLPSSPIGLLVRNNDNFSFIGIAAGGTLGVAALPVGATSYGIRGSVVYRTT